MKDNINKEITDIKNNIDILPKKNKVQRDKYLEYISDNISKFTKIKNDIVNEINSRCNKIKSNYNIMDTNIVNEELEIDNIKYSNNYISNMEKLNLPLYLYKLSHFYNNDLDEINNVIDKILKAFNTCGIKLTKEEFNITSYVSTYMDAFINKKTNLHELFEKIYWDNPNIIFQININFRYLYNKYEKVIDKFFKEHFSNYNIDKDIKVYKDNVINNNNIIHNDKNYMYSKMINKEVSYTDYLDKSIESIKNPIVLEENDDTYNNLSKLYVNINNYRVFLDYEYIIKDIKELYKNVESYKGQFDNKLKEINKNLSELFKINKNLSKTSGLFKLKDDKRKVLINKQSTLLDTIFNLYKELDDITVFDTIYKYINTESNYIDIIKVFCFNFNYFKNIYTRLEKEINIDDIVNDMNRLARFIYGEDIQILDNIFLSEEKDISMIIRDRYRLVNIMVTEDNLLLDNLEGFSNNIKKLLEYYDIKRNNINLDDIDYLLKVEKTLEEK